MQKHVTFRRSVQPYVFSAILNAVTFEHMGLLNFPWLDLTSYLDRQYSQ